MRIRNYTRNPIQTVGLYGGALMDISSHGMDLTRALFGQEIVRARCLQIDGGPRCGGYAKDLRGDDTYAVTMYALEDDTKVIQEAAWAQVSQVDRFDVEIHGNKGALYIKHEFLQEPLLLGITQSGVETDTQWSTPEIEKTFWGERQHRLFIEDIRNDTNNSLSARDGFITLATMEAVCRSCESGTWETPSRPKD